MICNGIIREIWWHDIRRKTMQRLVLGLVVGLVVGLVLGLVLG